MVKVKPVDVKKAQDTPKILDHFFRHQWAQVISHLTRVIRAENFELIEDSVQEAFIRAMQVWPYQGQPQNPEAWILTVARNNAYDVLRRRKTFQKRSRVVEDQN
jgi:RNA polymerase sigma factor (sigma-70 family)